MTKTTKTELLDSAERAARAQGFDGFSYADLARDVGIRKASIHHHFPSKADLSVAMMQRYSRAFSEACDGIDAAHIRGADRLAALVHRYRQALNDGKTLCLCVSFSTSRESLPAEVITQIKDFRAMMIAWLQQVFELGAADGSIKGVFDPSGEAAATLSLLEGAQLTARAEEDTARFDNAVQVLLGRCDQGAAATA